jgi:hypothetical protein
MSPVLKRQPSAFPEHRLAAYADDYVFPEHIDLHEDDLREIEDAMVNPPAPNAAIRALFKK